METAPILEMARAYGLRPRLWLLIGLSMNFYLKKILKNIKHWQRNGGFKFWLEVKITRLIDIFSAVFSNQFFSLEAGTVKKLKLIGNLSDCLQILTVGR